MGNRNWINSYDSLTDVFVKNGFLNYSNEQNLEIIDYECQQFLTYRLMNLQDIDSYYAYNLRFSKRGDKITILPSNIVCALWFIGEFPDNPGIILKHNRYENQKYVYTFDIRTNKLNKKEKK